MGRKIFIKLAFILIIGLSLVSCEKVIEVDLNEADTRLVIEANITTDSVRNKVTLTTSGGYFDNSAVQPVKGAQVRISDEIGNSEILQEGNDGVYYMQNLTGTENTEYSIEVIVEDNVYTAQEFLPVAVPIDSLYYEIDDFVPPGNEEEGDQYNLRITISDPVDTVNYYRLVTYVNDTLSTGGGFNLYRVIDDELIDGLTITLTVRGTEAKLGDTVLVELQSIGFNTYTYFNELNDAIYGGGGPGSTPYNPATNLDNNALGYFGAYSFTSETIIIEE